jgi:hypothetical protein
VAVGDGAVWAVFGDSTLARVDPATLAEAGSLISGDAPFTEGAAAASFGASFGATAAASAAFGLVSAFAEPSVGFVAGAVGLAAAGVVDAAPAGAAGWEGASVPPEQPAAKMDAASAATSRATGPAAVCCS